MKKAITGFFMSWGMFCAIPCPLKIWDENAKLYSVVMLPILGFVIGAVWAVVAFLLSLLGAPQLLSAAILAVCTALVSGFIHLDGFMDCCDAILSRRDLAERQRILKDSHTGAFAVISVVILFLLQFGAFAEFAGKNVWMLVFLPAGSFAYPGGWLFLGLLFVPMLLFGAVLLCRAPELLKKRLDAKEKEQTQRGVVAMSGLIFLGGFVIAGLDFRFGWSQIPVWGIITASVLLLASYGMYMEVMRENAYLSRTVEVQKGQVVIDTGLYGIVRHPMYAATVVLFLSIPIVLGSVWSFLCFLLYIPVIAVRICNEEKILSSGLPGYEDYLRRVKYRLIPFIW